MERDHPGEFIHLEWQFVQMLASSGAAARASYYQVNYAPTVVFDGTDEIRGWTTGTAFLYEDAFRDRSSALSQIDVEAEATFDELTRSGAVTVTVSVAAGETISDHASASIRCAIYEDDLKAFNRTWHFIGRAVVLDRPLTISGSGEVQVEAATFDLSDPEPPPAAVPWGPARNFRAIAFVQRDDDREILNAARATLVPFSIQSESWARTKARYR